MKTSKAIIVIFACLSILLCCSYVTVASDNSTQLVLFTKDMGTDVYSNDYGYLLSLEEIFEGEHPGVDLSIVNDFGGIKQFFWGDDVPVVPDVMILTRSYMIHHSKVYGLEPDWYQSLFMDLTPYMQTDRRLPEFVDFKADNNDESVRAIPLCFTIDGLFEFNTDVFLRAGLPSPRELYANGEWTWDSFVALSKSLTESIRQSLGSEEFYAWRGSLSYTYLFHICRQLGGRLIDWTTGQVDPDGILRSALDMCKTINDKSLALVSQDNDTIGAFNDRYRSEDPFVSGRLGFTSARIHPRDMGERWDSVYRAIGSRIEDLEGGEAEYDERYLDMLHRYSGDVKAWSEENYTNTPDIVPWPVAKQGQDPVFRLSIYWLAIPKQTENIDLAWDLVECMVSSRVHTGNAYPSYWIPANLSLLESEEYQEIYGKDAVETLINCATYGYEWGPPFGQITDGDLADFMFRLGDIYGQFIRDEKDLDETYDSIVRASQMFGSR